MGIGEFLKEGVEVKLTFYENEPLDVELPTTIDLKVIKAESAVRGDTRHRRDQEEWKSRPVPRSIRQLCG